MFARKTFERRWRWMRWHAITFHSISVDRTFCMRFVFIVNFNGKNWKEIQITFWRFEVKEIDLTRMAMNSRFSRYVSSESKWLGRLPKILLRSARLTCVKCEFAAGKHTVLLIWSSSLIGLELIACVVFTVWFGFSVVLFRFVKSPKIITTTATKIKCKFLRK